MEFECHNIIIGGDFNIDLDVQIDKEGSLNKTHTSFRKMLIELTEAQISLLSGEYNIQIQDNTLGEEITT